VDASGLPDWPGHKGKCGQLYISEKMLEQKFREFLGGLRFDDKIMSWVRAALTRSHADERREQDAPIERLQVEYDRLQNRVHAAYVDKLDGRIDTAFFDRISAEWRREQERCLCEIEQHQEADQSYLLVSNCSWMGSELTAEMRQPFDLFYQTIASTNAKEAIESGFDGLNEIRLPFMNTYRTLCLQPSARFRELLADMGRLAPAD
jgi:site-specific DNA recombinase